MKELQKRRQKTYKKAKNPFDSTKGFKNFQLNLDFINFAFVGKKKKFKNFILFAISAAKTEKNNPQAVPMIIWIGQDVIDNFIITILIPAVKMVCNK